MPSGDYTATISYGDPQQEGSTAFCYQGALDFTILARKTIQKTITASLTNSVMQPRMRRVVQEILFRSAIHRPDRSGQQFQFHPLLVARYSDLRQAGKQTSAQRYGGEGAERRESGIPAAADRCHDGPHLAQNPDRRFAGGTGQHQHPTGRYADRSTPAGNRTQPRSITPYKIS